ncbi:phosphoribosyl-ATP pyrophosphohydrolase [Dyadobacter sp. BE34]|uniref:Phosphoribosyl-ATP pyrophosphohydrolase n=1 Tax=Dyadobacter fermentans TaxID=94254 RepID=A0ABU1R5K5_9BACT|nr:MULTISPECIES: hypothetical protein [Dyadobacter]MDR6808235.1 phosphoribosyl-ATP pyrophosphohydrolase [Dyadobacter fermentans]MDR7045949.1 phosphoribosyl-ATP pyrophosphohydrolase [Dyadobacter sp. BE242]MDR7200262.1 phosphoribosyl-ATP pyrophosphohydrolase [Dyadobacter sp. BE34]MDR7218222.1 phosphoribosyl-ATP pyrophosphohydrolase [Dyadobacter sp. BE31]MDR7266153.1 phosphoribosyl-ATP pyrophosphohydrolase [Dyadobacter sp. BE32]
MTEKLMEKEAVVQALYTASTQEAIDKAGENWSELYQSASEKDKEYLRSEMRKFSQWVLAKCEESHEEFKQVLAEFEAMKLAESQHQ